MNLLSRLGRFLRRSIENPNISLDSDEAFELFGAKKSESGVKVTHQSIFEYSPIYRGVVLVSTMVAKVPLEILKRGPEGRGKTRAKDHFAYQMLRYKANPEMTAFAFRQTMQALAMLWGNTYAWLIRDEAGRVVEQLLLRPDRVVPVRFEGQLQYVITIGGDLQTAPAVPKRVPAEDILHIRGLGSNGVTGYNVVSLSKTSVGSAIAAEQYSGHFFGNHAKAGAVIEVEGQLSKAAYARLTRDWNRMNSKLSESHRTAILEEGAKLKPFTVPAKDAQLIESKKHDLVSASNWIGAPIHKIGGEGRTAFKSLEEENQSFLDESIDGWFCNWEQEYRDKVLTEKQKSDDSHIIEFRRTAMVRANIVKRYAAYRIGIGGHPFLTVNEVREAENLNPIDGGDELVSPLNMQPATKNKPDEKPDDENDDGKEGDDKDGESSAEDQNEESLRAIAELLVVDIGRAIKRMSVRGLKWIRAGSWPNPDEDLAAGIREILEPSYRVICSRQHLSDPFDTIEKYTDYLVDHYRREMDRCIREHSGSSVDFIAACCLEYEHKSSRELAIILTDYKKELPQPRKATP